MFVVSSSLIRRCTYLNQKPNNNNNIQTLISYQSRLLAYKINHNNNNIILLCKYSFNNPKHIGHKTFMVDHKPIIEDHDSPQSLHRLKPHLFALPRHYEYLLEPSIDDMLVKGSGRIDFEVIKLPDINSKRLVCYLNSHQRIKIIKASIDGQDVTFEPLKTLDNHDYKGSVIKYLIPMSKSCLVDAIGKRFYLDLQYEAKISNDLDGQYLAKSSIKGHGCQTILATQFEPNYARQAFPCVDEPECKATFKFSFLVDENLEVLHNTKLVSKSHDASSGKILHTFDPTMKLSSYLIAYLIGNFDITSRRVKNSDRSDILVQCIGPQHTLPYISRTLDHSCNVMDQLITLLGKFPIDKVSHVALPDFNSGAMENMGLITYRDNILQLTPESSLRQIMRCIEVICHELSHTWFGNLVTMRWWTELWLNESFATNVAYLASQRFYERHGAAHKYPFLQVFTSGTKYGGMDLDSRENSHPVYMDVQKPEDIESIFDEITYNKGSSLLYMCMGFTGEKNFFDAVRLYISRFQLGNAEAQDLWQAMDQHTNLPVSKTMEFWINNQGFPCLEVSLMEPQEKDDCNDSSTRLLFKQHRFRDVHREHHHDHQQIWPIPIVLKYSTSNIDDSDPHLHQHNQFSKTIHMTKSEMIVELFDNSKSDKNQKLTSLCPNGDGFGFYIYSLDDKLHKINQKNHLHMMSDIEKIEYIKNLGYLMKSTIETHSKSSNLKNDNKKCIETSSTTKTQRYQQYTLKYVLDCIRLLSIKQNDYAARLAMHQLFNKILLIGRKCDTIHNGFYKKLLDLIQQMISSYDIPCIDQCITCEDYNRSSAELELLALHVELETPSVLESMRELFKNQSSKAIHDCLLFMVHRIASKDFEKHLMQSCQDQNIIEEKIVDFIDSYLANCDMRTRNSSIMGFGKGFSSKVIRAFYGYAFSKKSRLQDLIFYLFSVSTPSHSSELLKYIKDNSSHIMETIPHSSRMDIIKSLKLCCTQDELKQIQDLCTQTSQFCQERIVEQTCDYIKANINEIEIFSKQLP